MKCIDGTIAHVGDIVIRKRGGPYQHNEYGVVVKYLPKTGGYRIQFTHVKNVYNTDKSNGELYNIVQTPTKQYCSHNPGILLNNRGKHKREGHFCKWDGKPVKYATRKKNTH